MFHKGDFYALQFIIRPFKARFLGETKMANTATNVHWGFGTWSVLLSYLYIRRTSQDQSHVLNQLLFQLQCPEVSRVNLRWNQWCAATKSHVVLRTIGQNILLNSGLFVVIRKIRHPTVLNRTGYQTCWSKNKEADKLYPAFPKFSKQISLLSRTYKTPVAVFLRFMKGSFGC